MLKGSNSNPACGSIHEIITVLNNGLTLNSYVILNKIAPFIFLYNAPNLLNTPNRPVLPIIDSIISMTITACMVRDAMSSH
jgi:hypothetical protein